MGLEYSEMMNWLTTNAYRPLREQSDLRGSGERAYTPKDRLVDNVAQKSFKTLKNSTDQIQKPIFLKRLSDQIFPKIEALFRKILGRPEAYPAEDDQESEILLNENMLSSDWEARSLMPIDYPSFEPSQDPYTQKSELTPEKIERTGRSAFSEKKSWFKAIDRSTIFGSALSFTVSIISTTIRLATHAISPIAPAVPFIGLFNGLANGFAIGKGVDRLRFYSKLKKELRACRYNEAEGNFGQYSKALLQKYPQLAGRAIAPSRLHKFLESEVKRKKIKYAFYMVSKGLGVGAAVVSFLGGADRLCHSSHCLSSSFHRLALCPFILRHWSNGQSNRQIDARSSAQ